MDDILCLEAKWTINQSCVLITVPSRKVGEKIAHLLLEQKLAACVNIIPEIYSFFTWEGKINHESETLLLVKVEQAYLKIT